MKKFKYTAEEIVPHSPPMVLLDSIVEQKEEELTASITIKETSRFFDASVDGVPTWVGIEYMAQAIASLAGIKAKDDNQAIKLGFLLGTRKYHMNSKVLACDETYLINVKQLYMDGSGLASFECQIINKANSDVCAKAKLNVFETDDAAQILEK